MPSYDPDKPDSIFQTTKHTQKEHKREVYLSYLSRCLQIDTLSLAIQRAEMALSALPAPVEKEESSPRPRHLGARILGNLLFGSILGFLGWRNIWLYLSFSPGQGRDWGFLSFGLILGGLCLLIAIHFLRHGIMSLLLVLHKGYSESENVASDFSKTEKAVTTPKEAQKALLALREELLPLRESSEPKGILPKEYLELLPASFLYDQLKLGNCSTLYGEEGACAALHRFQMREDYEPNLETLSLELEKHRKELPTLCECLEEASKLSASLESEFSKALQAHTQFLPESLPAYRDISERIRALKNEG